MTSLKKNLSLSIKMLKLKPTQARFEELLAFVV